MGQPQRAVTITLGGTELQLRYEAYELMELKRITGKGIMQFISELQPAEGESKEDSVLRTADLWTVVPVVQAGLASDPSYAKLSPQALSKRICGLMDKEAAATKQSILAVAGLVAAEVWPVFTLACLPPGVTLEEATATQTSGGGAPLEQAPAEAPTGTSAGTP